jgi:hypothetical protein
LIRSYLLTFCAFVTFGALSTRRPKKKRVTKTHESESLSVIFGE